MGSHVHSRCNLADKEGGEATARAHPLGPEDTVKMTCAGLKLMSHEKIMWGSVETDPAWSLVLKSDHWMYSFLNSIEMILTSMIIYKGTSKEFKQYGIEG